MDSITRLVVSLDWGDEEQVKESIGQWVKFANEIGVGSSSKKQISNTLR